MNTRDKILTLADKLIRQKGFNAFSYKDISSALVLKNAAIHYHFPSKTDLGIGVIEDYSQKFREKTSEWVDLPEDVQFKNLVSMFQEKNSQGLICLMGSLSPDYETLPAKMQTKLHELSSDILVWLSACLEKGRNNQLIHFEGSTQDRALVIIGNLMSSLLLARVLGKPAFDSIKQQLLHDYIQ